MSDPPHPLDLLTRSAKVLSTSLERASSAAPASPTPCAEWDLETLVRHVTHSAATLHEAIEGADPGPVPAGGCARAQHALRRLREVAERAPRHRPIVELAALTGAFELLVHAWDIDQATGTPDALPTDLVSTLLAFTPLVLGDVERNGLFAEEVSPHGHRSDTDRLLALFGRRRETH